MIHFFPSREILLSLGSFEVHWYGMMYLFGFLIGWYLFPRIQKYRGLSLRRDEVDALIFHEALAVIIGARLGEVIFWDPGYFFQNPLKIFYVWEGGMSSHGGFIAVILVTWWYCRKYKVNFWALGDVVVVPLAIGLILGRFGNFINQEIYGTITSLPWGMYFDGVEGPRHPTQIYSMLKDAVIAAACFWNLRRTQNMRPGRNVALFLMLYGVLRFTVEYFRDQTGYPPWEIASLTITQGQMLTLPFLVAGIVIWFIRSPKRGLIGK